MPNDNVVHLNKRAEASNPTEPSEPIIKALSDALELARAGKVHDLAMAFINESNAEEWTAQRFWRVNTFERAAWISASVSAIGFELCASMSESAEDE